MKSSKVIIVLGMHRSGTSTIARGLEVLGVSLGTNLHPADGDNPKGFWEDRDFLSINEELLAHLGFSYDRLGLIEWTMPNTSAIDSIRQKAEKLVREKCAKDTLWGFKDPRTARLLSFWQPVFDNAGCDVGYIIAIRNPISIVDSLRKHGFKPVQSYYLWLEHLIPAVSRTKGASRVVVDYDQLLENPEHQLLRVAQAFDLHAPESLALAVYKNEFLEKALRHTVYRTQDVERCSSTPSQVVTAVDWLAKLAKDDLTLDDPRVEQAFDALSRDLVGLSPALELMARQEQIAALNQQAKEIQRLEAFIVEKQRAIAHLTANEIDKQRVIDYLSANEEILNTQREQIRTELHTSAREYRALKQTRWFRLRDALLFQPFSFRKLLHITDIVLGGLVPRNLRSLMVPQLERLIGPLPMATVTIAERVVAYQVRLPPAPSQDAPKVVHVIANFMTGGSSRLVVDLVEYLGSSFRQDILTSFNPDPPAYVGLKIDECRCPDSMEPFVQYFRRSRPDFVHVHYWGDCDEPWYAKAIEAAKFLGLTVIENINTPIEPYCSESVARYVYVSDYVRNVFGESDSRHVTIYPGADFKHFTRKDSEYAPDDCVGMVYRLERDKLDENAILPFIRIAQLRPQTRILIVGGGSLLEIFQSSVRIAGLKDNFEFTGYVSYDQLPDLYRKMSIFLVPVWKESFGQVVPFAMSMKIPIVGYDVGAIGEIVGDPGLLVPAADVEALARMAIDLLDAPQRRRELGEILQRRAEDKFSLKNMNYQYAQLYTQITQEVRKVLV